jgi:hypothetical protein
VRLDPERAGRGARAGDVVGVGQFDGLRRAGGAGGAHGRVDRVGVEAGRERHARRFRRGRAGVRGRRLGRRARLEHGAEARQRVEQLGEGKPRRMRDRHAVAGAHA